MMVGGQRHASDDLAPRKTRYPLYRKMDRPQGRFGQVRKMSSPLGFFFFKLFILSVFSY
jgi:hypothetical protein